MVVSIMTMDLEGGPFPGIYIVGFVVIALYMSVGIMSSLIYPGLARAMSYTSITPELHYTSTETY